MRRTWATCNCQFIWRREVYGEKATIVKGRNDLRSRTSEMPTLSQATELIGVRKVSPRGSVKLRRKSLLYLNRSIDEGLPPHSAGSKKRVAMITREHYPRRSQDRDSSRRPKGFKPNQARLTGGLKPNLSRFKWHGSGYDRTISAMLLCLPITAVQKCPLGAGNEDLGLASPKSQLQLSLGAIPTSLKDRAASDIVIGE